MKSLTADSVRPSTSNGKSPIKPFAPNASFLKPLKTSENLSVFCFQRVEKGCIGNEWVKDYNMQVHFYEMRKERQTPTDACFTDSHSEDKFDKSRIKAGIAPN